MDWEKIVIEKGGKILERSGDPFTPHSIRCANHHIFSIHAPDITMGKWCEVCGKNMSDISSIFDSLGIPYKYQEVVEGHECDYYIESKKFAIFIGHDPGEIKGCKRIIINDKDYPELKSELWEALKHDKEYTVIPEVKVEKPKDAPGHICELETVLYKPGNSEVCSITKEALKPYPINVNYAVAYIRVSTREQAKDGFSLEAQERYVFEEALKRGLFLKKIYIDRGISGASTEKRAALAKMREELEPGEWLISCYVSRIARNTKDLLSIRDEVAEKKCHLVIKELDMDITSPAGNLILTMMAGQAQFERDQTAERVKSVIDHLKKTGKFRSKPHYGWRMNPDRSSNEIHIRDPDELKVIQRIRRLRNKYPDEKITAFTRRVNECNIPPPRNAKQWYHRMLGETMKREGIK